MRRVLLGAVLLLAVPAAHAATGAAIFTERCSPCHTIGGGDQAGPDLIAAKRLQRDELRAAVTRMQTNVGAMRNADIDALVVYLANVGPKGKPLPPPPPRGVAANGRRLFFGDRPLANGGSPCFACHTIEGRGGNLAVDLTNAKTNVVAVVTRPPFPMMRAAYARHAVTEAEALDLAAFVGAAQTARREGIGMMHGAAAGIALLAFASVGLIVKRRRSAP